MSDDGYIIGDPPYSELEGYPVESMDSNGNFTATRKVITGWDNRFDVRKILLRGNGQLYPYITDSKARCRAVTVEPLGVEGHLWDDVGLAHYQKALVTAVYETPKIDESQPHPDPIYAEDPAKAISENLRPWSEARRLPYEKFKWASDSEALKPDEAPIEMVCRVDYSLTRYNLPVVPNVLAAMEGTINDDDVSPILITGWTFPAHTLLLQPPTLQNSADEEGNPTFDITYSFLYKEEGWRKFWRGDKAGTSIGGYDSIVDVDGNPYNKPDEADFSILFP